MSAALARSTLAHIQGPIEPLTWVTIGVSALFVAWTIVRAVRYSIHPGEEEPDHIKRSILAEPQQIHVAVGSQERRP